MPHQISTGDTSEQGRFHLVRDDDGWTIEAPFVQIDLVAGNLDVVELGGMRRKVERTAVGPDASVPLLVFPGVYELYPSLADRITFDPTVLIATSRESKDMTLRYTTGHTLTDTGTDAAQHAINAHIDNCATRTEIAPAGCPFNAEESRMVRGLTGLSDIVWTVVTHPEAHVVAGNDGDLTLVVRKPGTIRLTGSGVPEEPEGSPRTTSTATCEVGLANLTVAMTMDGFTAGGVTDDRYSGALETLCF